jgi:survival-of-motor-neuron-related-splicing factor 30
MDKADLETYQVQLSQVELALAADPGNAELSSLHSELKELIDLTKAALSQTEAASSSSKAESSRKAVAAEQGRKWAAGDECLAKYSGDGSWYPARITSLGGSAENRVYSIVFKGYNTTELVKSGEMKPIPANYVAPPVSNKRKLTKAEEDEREKKKKKNEKKVETRAAKAKEQNDKQATWQKFAKKSEKKGIHIAGVTGTSIFKTPENPLGKVGVTGSGKGMTEVAQSKRHKFTAEADDY